MAVYYIEADVHSNNTESAVEHKGKVVQRHSVATTVRAIRRVLEGLDGRKHLAMEEGPSGWLYRHLADRIDSPVVCDPGRNKWIAADRTRIAALQAGSVSLGSHQREGVLCTPMASLEKPKRPAGTD